MVLTSQDRTAGLLGETLGHFVADSRWDRLPYPLRHEAKRALLNYVGCAAGAAPTDPVAVATRVLGQLSGSDRVTVIGRGERLDPLGAAFVNAVSANLLEYDDTHMRTVIHPTATVASAVLALAEQRKLSGAAALHALVLGAETECRIGNAVSPGHYARGWHITATCGVFGAAAASAKLLGLNAIQIWNALGIAANQSGGLVENLATAAKNVSVGNAARNGIFAALLAEQGYAAAPAAIEGPFGWARAMGDEPARDEVARGLGDEWEFLKNTYKPYPCGVVMHAVIDACLALRQQYALNPSDVAGIVVSGNQLLLDRGDRTVLTERDARVSVQHCAAISFAFGAAGLCEFSEVSIRDPTVVALRARTTVKLAPESPRGAATVVVRTSDGRTLEATMLHPKGSLEHPLSDLEIEAKVRALAHYGSLGGEIEDVIAAVWQLDRTDSVAPWMRTLAPRPE